MCGLMTMSAIWLCDSWSLFARIIPGRVVVSTFAYFIPSSSNVASFCSSVFANFLLNSVEFVACFKN